MKRSVPLGAVLAALAVVVVTAAAFGIGRLVGPIDSNDAAAGHGGGHGDRVVLTPPSGDDAGHGDHGDHGAAAPGLALDLATPALAAGAGELAFVVRDGDGAPVRDVEVRHEKPLHLVLVRRDLGDFRHLHPRLDPASGTWTTPVDLTPGVWRVYADLVPTGGDQVVAEADLSVAGDYRPLAPVPDRDVATVDGYRVALERTDGRLTFAITRDGAPVTDLEPYLGASAHLVAIDVADLGYAHVHPVDGPAGPRVAFAADLVPGRHRLYLEFAHAGAVHRAELAVTVPGAGGSSGSDQQDQQKEDDGHDHQH